MAKTIKDPAMGLVPKGQPKLYKSFTVGATDIKKYQNVKLVSGVLVDATEGSSTVLGVAMSHGSQYDSVVVCVDPDCIYEGTGDIPVVEATHVGTYASMADSSIFNGDMSDAVVDLTNVEATIGTNQLIIVGVPQTVTNAADAANFKVLVKLVATQFVT